MIGEGRASKVYLGDNNTVVKLYKNIPISEALHEANNQRVAYEAGLLVPKIYDVRQLGDNVVAVEMEYIVGSHPVTFNMSRDEMIEGLEITARLHFKVHTVKAPGLTHQHELMKSKINRGRFLDGEIKARMLTFISQNLQEADCLCHGDFHPLNVIQSPHSYYIIDWVDACSGNPYIDVCRSCLLLEEQLEDMVEVYLKEYCRTAKLSPDDIWRYRPVVTAVRIEENIDEQLRQKYLRALTI